jgi:uncharacterized membrane protein
MLPDTTSCRSGCSAARAFWVSLLMLLLCCLVLAVACAIMAVLSTVPGPPALVAGEPTATPEPAWWKAEGRGLKDNSTFIVQ